MDRVLIDNIWRDIAPLVRKQKKVAALAYVSTDKHLTFRTGDTLLCDASDQAIRSGQTSAYVLGKFHKEGAKLYSCPNLHAKAIVFGGNVLIGSNNLSESSANQLREMAILSSRSSVVSQARAFIHRLKEESEPIDAEFLERIRTIKVIKRKALKHRRGRRSKVLGNRTWVIRSYQIDTDRYKDEEKYVEEAEKEVRKKLTDHDNDIGWLRWIGKSKFRSFAKEGDTIIGLSSLRKGKQVTVSASVPILKRQDRGKWTRFYYEDTERTMSWTAFEKQLRRLGIRHLKRSSTKELNVKDVALIDTIWSD